MTGNWFDANYEIPNEERGAARLASLIGLLVSMVINGLALMKLWGWFLVPLGVPAIGFVAAMGVCVLASFLFVPPTPWQARNTMWSYVGVHVKSIEIAISALIIGGILTLFL